MARLRLLPLLAVAFLACPAQDPLVGVGTANLQGDHAFTVHSAVAAIRDGGAAASGFWLTDANTNCEDMTHRGFIPFINNAVSGVIVSLSDDTLVPGDVPVTDDGINPTYPDGGLRVVTARVAAKHQDETFEDSVAGSLSYDAADRMHLKGHFAVTLKSDGGTPYDMSGDFDAPVCLTYTF